MRKTRSQGEVHTPRKKDINKHLREIKRNKAKSEQGATSSSKGTQQEEASPFTQGPQVRQEELYQVEKPQEEAQRAAPRDWLNHLQGGPFDTFDNVAKRFLKRYFPSTLTAKLRKEITNIQQRGDETLQEYYERFVRLCASCPNHNLTETSLLDQFIQGMNALEARLLQCSAGGSFNDKTPAEVRTLIETMAEGNLGRDGILGQVNTTSTVDLKAMESRITANFESKFNKVLKAVGAKMEPTPCEFCASTDHATDECDTLQDVNHVDGYQRPQYAYEPWKKNPNLRWRDNPQFQQPQQGYQKSGVYVHPNAQSQHQPQQQAPQPPPPTPQASSSNTEFAQILAMMQGMSGQISGQTSLINNIKEELKGEITTLAQSQATQGRQMQNLEMQVKQIAGEVNVLKGQMGNKLPSQGSDPTNLKPINAIQLRSGKQVEFPREEEEVMVQRSKEDESSTKEVHDVEYGNINEGRERGKGVKEKAQEKEKEVPKEKSHTPKAPFPHRLTVNTKKDELDKDILEVFKKVEVNIPIIDAIRMHPPYARFFKNLCTNKRKLKGTKR
ncbi:hypothetical protein LUZ60_004685 [Juncus effusus]|nr:hypothetical protein LUZ60_004685 [Juncus effusus]